MYWCKVRLRTPKGQECSWRDYKAVRLGGIYYGALEGDRHFTVTLQAWHQMLIRGTKHELMYRHPFTLVRIVVTDDTNISVWKPMWLIVIGAFF